MFNLCVSSKQTKTNKELIQSTRASTCEKFFCFTYFRRQSSSSMLLDSSKEIVAGIAALFKDERTSDVTLYIGDERTAIKAHRVILSLQSDFFKAMLYSDLQEGISHEVEMPEPLSEVIPVVEFMYTNRIELDSDNIISILGVAHKYQVKSLCHLIVADLHKEITTMDGAFQVLQIADYYQLKQLERSALRFIFASFSMVVRSDAFLKLEMPTVMKLLNDEELFASELLIFTAVDRYIRERNIEDDEKRHKLLSCVRLCYVPLKEMFTVIRPSKRFSEQAIYAALEYQANPHTSSYIFTPRKFGSAADTEELVFGKAEGKIVHVSDQEPNRNADNLRDGSNDGWYVQWAGWFVMCDVVGNVWCVVCNVMCAWFVC